VDKVEPRKSSVADSAEAGCKDLAYVSIKLGRGNVGFRLVRKNLVKKSMWSKVVFLSFAFFDPRVELGSLPIDGEMGIFHNTVHGSF